MPARTSVRSPFAKPSIPPSARNTALFLGFIISESCWAEKVNGWALSLSHQEPLDVLLSEIEAGRTLKAEIFTELRLAEPGDAG